VSALIRTIVAGFLVVGVAGSSLFCTRGCADEKEWSRNEQEALNLIQQGQIHRSNGDFDRADRVFAEAIKKAPSLEEGWYVRLENMSLEMLSRIDVDDKETRYQLLVKAIDLGERAFRLHPRSARISNHLGWLYFNKMGPHAAAEAYSLYIQKRLWLGKGKGSAEEALRWFKLAAANKPHPVYSPWFLDLNVARAYPLAVEEKMRLDCYEQARQLVALGERYIRRLLSIYGSNPDYNSELEGRLKVLKELAKKIPPPPKPQGGKNAP